MAEAIYGLCAATSVLCAFLLLRGWRKTSVRLLLWSAACFAGLAAANVLMFFDLVIVPQVDFSMVRNAIALVALLVLLIGMIWEARA